MAQNRKRIVHSTAGDYTSSYDILSQTPGNYNKDNYYLRELQEKVIADWDYRPNRAMIEYEENIFKEIDGDLMRVAGDYKPIEVVLQSVISEKGAPISNDTRNIVFKNITEDRFNIGNKFRFSRNFDLNSKDKDTWLVINKNDAKLTASVVAQRCNGTLISVDPETNKTHTEPVIQGMDLSAVSVFYNDTMVSPQSQLVIIAQHNEFTSKYFINERFIVGYDRVYKIKAINKFYGNFTDDPHNVGVMKIYLEITEQSEYDDMRRRIAYQMGDVPIPYTTPESNGYEIAFNVPQPIPTELTSELINFVPVVKDENNIEYPEVDITTTIQIENISASNVGQYVIFTKDDDSSNFSLKRKKLCLRGDLIVNCSAVNPVTNEEFMTSFRIGLSASE